MGSLLSSCWQLRKTMPIHSLGIGAFIGLDVILFVGSGRGGLSLHSLTGGGGATFSTPFVRHKTKCNSVELIHIKTCLVYLRLWFYMCKPGQRTAFQCWQHECVPPGKQKAAWKAASRLETLETVARTITKPQTCTLAFGHKHRITRCTVRKQDFLPL